MSRNNEDLIRLACDEVIGKGNFDVLEEVFASDYVAHASSGTFEGRDFIGKFGKQLRSAIPDLEVLEIEFLAQTDDTVVWQRSLGGTHEGGMMGIPASKQSVKWNEMVVSRFASERIAEEWVVSELTGELLSKVR